MGKGQFIKTYDDMKGKKLRASGAIHTEVIKLLGGVPVGMPAPEVYIALEKGIVDGAFVPWDFIYSFRTDPVLSSVTEIGVCGFTFVVTMNLDVYNNMPADLRAMIDEVSPKYSGILGAEHDRLVVVAQKLLADAGGEVYKLSAADMEKVGTALAPMWENWIGGDTTKKQLVDDLYYTLKDMGAEIPLHGYTP